MQPFLLILMTLFALLGHGYFWVAIVNRLHAWAGVRAIIDLSTLASAIGFLALPFVIGWQWWLVGASLFNGKSLSLIAHLSLVYFLACAFFGFGKLLTKLVGTSHEDESATVLSKHRQFVDPTQPFPLETVQSTYGRFLTSLPGNQALRIAIDTKRLRIPRLPSAMSGLRVVHISDLHITGMIGQAWFDHVAAVINSLAADVIFVTGDLIENDACRLTLTNSMKSLRSKHGIFFVLGNHDFYIDSNRTINDLTALGWTYVGVEPAIRTWNNTPVLISGNELPWNKNMSDLRPMNQTVEGSPFHVMLMHTPDQFDWACSAAGDLALAGHNHGGQVCFPILGAVAAPSFYGTRFAGGTFRRGSTVMHVTRGISGETPLRWGCPPEVALLELVSQGS